MPARDGQGVTVYWSGFPSARRRNDASGMAIPEKWPYGEAMLRCCAFGTGAAGNLLYAMRLETAGGGRMKRVKTTVRDPGRASAGMTAARTRSTRWVKMVG